MFGVFYGAERNLGPEWVRTSIGFECGKPFETNIQIGVFVCVFVCLCVYVCDTWAVAVFNKPWDYGARPHWPELFLCMCRQSTLPIVFPFLSLLRRGELQPFSF